MDSSVAALVVHHSVSEVGGDRNQRRKAELSEDLIIEILARLPVKCLLRFKSVCKRWYSLILSPNFIAAHSTHSSHPKKKLSLAYRRWNCLETAVGFRFGEMLDNITFPGSDMMKAVHIVGCFNGVVCICSQLRYVLWNPATRQVREIDGARMFDPNGMPFPRNDGIWSGSAFCFEQVTNSFKVADINLAVLGGETRAHISEFSTATNSWTHKTMEVPWKIRYGSVIRRLSCLNRYIHWHIAILHPDEKVDDMYILSYDMIDEVFKRIEMPFPHLFSRIEMTYRNFNCFVHLADCNGSLALFVHWKKPSCTNVSYDEVEAWVMNGWSADQPWSKLLISTRSSKTGCSVEFYIKDSDCVVLESEFLGRKSIQRTFLYSESFASPN